MKKNINKCLTKCIPAGQLSVHPVTLEYIGNNTKKSYCATDDGDLLETNECPKHDLSSPLVPLIRFDAYEFLKECYKITSMTEAIEWLNKNSSKDVTKNRILHCAWRAFGQELLRSSGKVFEIKLNDIIVDYYVSESKSWKCKKPLSYDDIKNGLEKYVKKYANKWLSISSHSTKIKNFFCVV